ncbi:hypothetical protein RCO28_27880 [Streptomyces sp. LHD-70]|uniref:F0F1 ATP synthase subunit B family protein n=1 Tax=Streptomyces sp. LHD-70 TaxID=3072140 RepID=UPI0028107507|nr:hypothetical protein [Streptomyces sp. LHD-70]MDQ8706262.1 hypothetical protein [Streptomyces sp. LHD-70]
MYLLPEELNLGPLNLRVEDLVAAAVVFGAVFLLFRRVLVPRMANVLAEREARLDESLTGELHDEARVVREKCERLLAEARHEAARVRQGAAEEGAALVVAAREGAQRERAELLASGRAEIAAERAAAEAELRTQVPALAAELASRVVGEPVVVGEGRW